MEELSPSLDDEAKTFLANCDDDHYNILFIGNSITRHEITSYWWSDGRGMAATSQETDYVHQTETLLADKLRELKPGAKGIYGHESTFWILEAVCVLGLLMVICRQGILSRLNVTSDPATQLHNVMIYKRFYVYEIVIGAPLAVLAIAATLFIENTSSPVGYVAIALGVISAAGASWFGWQKHKSTMQEIEQNMADLKELAE